MNKQADTIILITVDSLRRDRLGCYSGQRALTPRLDAFAQTAVRYDNAYSNGPNTPHAFPAILSGREALSAPRLGLFDAHLTLAEVLAKAGYTCVGVNAANPYLSRYFGYDRGFNEFYDFLSSSGPEQKGDFPSDMITVPALAAEEYVVSEESIHNKQQLEQQLPHFVNQTLTRLKGKRFFLWLHYMDTHYPYAPDAAAQRQSGARAFSLAEMVDLNQRVRENIRPARSILSRTVELYDAAVVQQDRYVGEVLHHLQQLDLFDTSLIIFAADHGEEFMEHGDLQHRSKLYEELIHVPLLVKVPGQQMAADVAPVCSLMQIPATVASCAGLGNPFQSEALSATKRVARNEHGMVFSGASYVQDSRPPVDQQVFRINRLPKVFSCRSGNYKLILDTTTGQTLLFDLLTDAAETMNVAEKSSPVAERLRAGLCEHINLLEKKRLCFEIQRVRQNFQNVVA